MSTTTTNARHGVTSTRRHAAVLRFARHYLEMLVAMLLGMVTLHPAWSFLVGSVGGAGWTQRVEVDTIAMALAMTVPMAWWMARRGHATRPIVEMGLAMVAGFVVLFPLLWAGMVGPMTVMGLGHVLMLVFMLVAMLGRRAEYVGECGR